MAEDFDLQQRLADRQKSYLPRSDSKPLDILEAIERGARESQRIQANKRLDAFANDPYASWATYVQRTGKIRLAMTLHQAVTQGWYFADTWIKPLHYAMGYNAPSIG